ncbi:MAG: UbiX family flavin prenyltransferase [Planctomycetes bacterium]|nr:UbiX family flavin prenyltransferase [Planctomycetota bacterium]NQU50628.1 UbiX family flavin prenyltransferase [Planctomycetota bacterium]
MTAPTPQRVVLAVSGASGACYGVQTLRMLVQAGVEVDLIYSSAAKRVLMEEMSIQLDMDPQVLLQPGQSQACIYMHAHADIGAAPASGSGLAELVIVVPCSLSTVAGIANGSASNLIERAAQVALKEGKKLVVVPRETPLSRVHLDHLSRLAWAGATILPASPGFYHRPKTLDELVSQLCAKILGVCGIPQNEIAPWQGSEESA